ncbi:hypothetical protein [Methylobacterium sp. CM6257]
MRSADLDHLSLVEGRIGEAGTGQAHVLASTTLNRHLTYVATTLHREAVRLYAARDAFDDTRGAGGRPGGAGSIRGEAGIHAFPGGCASG